MAGLGHHEGGGAGDAGRLVPGPARGEGLAGEDHVRRAQAGVGQHHHGQVRVGCVLCASYICEVLLDDLEALTFFYLIVHSQVPQAERRQGSAGASRGPCTARRHQHPHPGSNVWCGLFRVVELCRYDDESSVKDQTYCTSKHITP